MNTRKFPRTMQEAFGPYATSRIYDPEESASYSTAWWILVALISVVTLVIIGGSL